MTTSTLLSSSPVVIGAIATVLIAVITRASWPAQTKRAITLAVYALAAVAVGVLRANAGLEADFMRVAAEVVAVGTVTYTALKQVKAWGLGDLLSRIELATSPAADKAAFKAATAAVLERAAEDVVPVGDYEGRHEAP